MLFNKNEGEMKNNLIIIISEGAKIGGNINGSGILKINGEVIGDIKSKNEVSIGREGRVEANIKTKDATIDGHFIGEMKASGHVSITSTGRFEGILIQENSSLSISKGGLFKGKSVIIDKNNVLKLGDNSKITHFTQLKKEKIITREIKVAV